MRISEVTSSGNFVRLVELFPPGLPVPELMRDSQKYDLSLRFDKLIESVSSLSTYADAFCLPDLKDSDRIHLNSIGIAEELKRQTGNEVIPTLTLRDSNKQSLLGSIAFAIFAGLENILIVRGDPYNSGERSSPKNVYDVQKVSSFVASIRRMEEHLSNQNKLCILSPINLTKISNPKYIQTIKERETSGIDIFIAESLFEDVNVYLERVKESRKAGITLPIIHNIFPLRSYEDAAACVKKFGWQISNAEIEALKIRGAEYGLEMARKRYQGLLERKDLVEGACISTRGNSELARLISL